MKRFSTMVFVVMAFVGGYLTYVGSVAHASGGVEEAVQSRGPVTYVSNAILVKLKSSVVKTLHAPEFNAGQSGYLPIDQLGKRFGVVNIEPLFPGSKPTLLKGRIHDLTGWHRIEFATEVDVEKVARDYGAVPGVIVAEPIPMTKWNESVPNDPQFVNQWHLEKIEATLAWTWETGKANIIVAILDSGVRYYHDDLGGFGSQKDNPPSINGNIWINELEIPGNGDDDDGNDYTDDWVGWNFWDKNNDPSDVRGHGTHCAGIVGALTNNGNDVSSVAGGWGDGTTQPYGNGVKIMPLRVGDFKYVNMKCVAKAFVYAADNGARIASCSFKCIQSEAVRDAIDLFTASGGLVFKAAGNEGQRICDYMCQMEDVITVAATDEDDCKADFSNYGPWIDISAPGTEILSTFHDMNDPDPDKVCYMTGTSMACPMTAAVAALIWSHYPTFSAEEVKNRLFETADDIYGIPGNEEYIGELGVGRINALRAVTPDVDCTVTARILRNGVPHDVTETFLFGCPNGDRGDVLEITCDFDDLDMLEHGILYVDPEDITLDTDELPISFCDPVSGGTRGDMRNGWVVTLTRTHIKGCSDCEGGACDPPNVGACDLPAIFAGAEIGVVEGLRVKSIDVNGDGVVDGEEYAGFVQTYNKSLGDPTFNGCYDFNADDFVNLSDFSFLSEHYGHQCPGAQSAPQLAREQSDVIVKFALQPMDESATDGHLRVTVRLENAQQASNICFGVTTKTGTLEFSGWTPNQKFSGESMATTVVRDGNQQLIIAGYDLQPVGGGTIELGTIDFVVRNDRYSVTAAADASASDDEFVVPFGDVVGTDGLVRTVAAAEVEREKAVFKDFLGDCHPNPFNPTTTISYSIKKRGHVTLNVYNVAGQLVRTLVNDVQAPSVMRHVVWNGRNSSGDAVSSGVYFYKLVATNFTQTKKMVLLK